MIDITEEAPRGLLADDPGGPVVILNLLRFRPDGGRDSYATYGERAGALSGRFGVEVVYLGSGDTALVADDGHQAWDAVLLVRYPSRQAFCDMIRDPDYQAIAHFRSEALLESVLQPTVPVDLKASG